MFSQDIADIGKQRVFLVGREHFLVLVLPADQQSGCFEPVQLDADCIGRLPELFLQPAQIGTGFRVQEEPEQQFDTGFVCD